MSALIQNSDAKKGSFNFTKFITTVRNCIKSSEYVIEPSQKRFLTVMNPIPPRIYYGLPKIHKEGNPLRPIASYISSPYLQTL